MRKQITAILSALLGFLFLAGVSLSQSVTPAGLASLKGAGVPDAGGIGDVLSGWAAWWSVARSYSIATAGTKAYNVCSPLGTNCVDVFSNAVTGIVPTPAPGGVTCNNVTYICVVDEAYDQTGNGCPVLQATLANMPALYIGALGTSNGLSSTNASGTYLKSSCSASSPVPFTFSAVYKITTGGIDEHIIDVTSHDINFGQITTGAGEIRMYSGSGSTSNGFNTTAADNAFHAANGTFRVSSGGGSTMYLDGTSNSSTSPDGTSLSGNYEWPGGKDGQYLTGIVMEGGVYPGDAASAFSALNSNQHTFYGF